MVNPQMISGNWNEVKGKLRERWGDLTDDELDQVHGNADQLFGLLQKKTGESREALEDQLDHLLGNESWYQATKHRLEDFGQSAAGAVQGGASYTAYQVREHPEGSLATCFTAGLVTGIVVALLLYSDD